MSDYLCLNMPCRHVDSYLCHTGTGGFSALPHSCIHLWTEAQASEVLEITQIFWGENQSSVCKAELLLEELVPQPICESDCGVRREAVLIHQIILDYWFLHYCLHILQACVLQALVLNLNRQYSCGSKFFRLSISDYKGTFCNLQDQKQFSGTGLCPFSFERQWK